MHIGKSVIWKAIEYAHPLKTWDRMFSYGWQFVCLFQMYYMDKNTTIFQKKKRSFCTDNKSSKTQLRNLL